MVAELAEAAPEAVCPDAALVSMVPVVMTGVLTEATVFVWLTPVCEVQPSVDRAERPDSTVEATLTFVPNADPAKPSCAAAGAAWAAATAGPAAASVPAAINPAATSENIRALADILRSSRQLGYLQVDYPDVA